MQRRAHESTSGVPVQWPVSVVQKPLGLRQSEKIPSKNFRVQRLEMAKQMKNIRQQRADERDKAAQIFTWCMVVAMHQEEGIGATRLERACNEMHEFQQRYRTKILTENRKSATDAMREDLKGICLVMAATTHLTFGFGKERLARLKQETLDNYRQYIGWVEQDGEAYAMELLRRCSEQALQEELKINDMRESKDHILPGGSAEAQRQICCGQWRPYRLRWQQSAALPASRWPF